MNSSKKVNELEKIMHGTESLFLSVCYFQDLPDGLYSWEVDAIGKEDTRDGDGRGMHEYSFMFKNWPCLFHCCHDDTSDTG